MAGIYLQITGYAGIMHTMLHLVIWHSLFLCYLSCRVCYERVKFFNPVIATFFLSAWWHGFYPAYYCLFIIIAMDIMAARKVTLFMYQKGI